MKRKFVPEQDVMRFYEPLVKLNADMGDDELIVDNFAGGGGASTGIEAGLGRPVDIAINHDASAIAMHRVNHPFTKHYCDSVWDVDPVEACGGRPVGLAWFSPDCKHHSKARGGRPVEKSIRGLAWIVQKWAGKKAPRICILENVEEIQDWCPLIAQRDKQTGRVIKKDGTVAAPGERVPVQDQRLVADKRRTGESFRKWNRALKRFGYHVEHRELRASDFGAPTIRKRFFLIARNDCQPIVWPEPTHGDPKREAVQEKGLQPWRTAAECIDWSIPCPSIFDRKKPLVDATLRRIAKGLVRYVIESQDPFIVTYYGMKDGEFRGQPINEPLRTQTTENRHALVTAQLEPVASQSDDAVDDEDITLAAPHIIGIDHRGAGDSCAWHVKAPITTITAEARHAVVSTKLAPVGTSKKVTDNRKKVTAFLKKYCGKELTGKVLRKGAGGDSPDLVEASHLVKLRGTCKDGQPVTKPMPTFTAGGTHVAEVRSYMVKYNGTDQDPRLEEPMHTITTKDRFGLVTINGNDYEIVDIGLRMLVPRELFNAHGFPQYYVIDHDDNGGPINKTIQVEKCGNSVPPALAEVLVKANYTRRPVVTNVPELAAA